MPPIKTQNFEIKNKYTFLLVYQVLILLYLKLWI